MTETIVDAILARLFQSPGLLPNQTVNRDNFTSSLFEKEPGEFRILQPIWDLRIGYEKYVSSPLFPIILSVTFYFMSVVPFTICDLFGRDWHWIQKYKIQTDRVVTWPAVKNAILLTVWNHLLFILPISMAQLVWTPATTLTTLAPGLWEFCWQQYAALAVFDFEYYVWHWLHHKVRFLYRHVHSIHHHYSSPNAWVTQYLHPYELVTVGIYSTTSSWWFGAHPMTQWSFMLFSIMVSVDAHIGYDLPFLPHQWMPFWGGSIKHDMHHQKPLCNYQPFFNWFDRLFGTECPGQRAGGYKPKAMADWEKKRSKSPESLPGQYGLSEPVMEAKQF